MTRTIEHPNLSVTRAGADGLLVNALGFERLPSWLTAERAAAVAELEPRSFPASELAARCEALRAELASRQLDGTLVFRPSSVEYLCGHHTINPYPQPVLVTHDDVRLYVLDIELARALASATAQHINFFATGTVGGVAQDTLAAIADDVAGALGRGARLALELGDVRVPPQMAGLLTDRGVTVVAAEELVERQRLVLSPAEIRKLEQAAEITQRGLDAAVLAAGRVGATDSSVAAAIFAALVDGANSSSAVTPIVATGMRGGVWHSTWKNVPLGESVTLLEFAGTCDRYHAPVMATVATREPDALERRLEGLAQAALAGMLAEVRPGRVAGEAAQAAAAHVGELEPDDMYHWNFGYTTGLGHPPTWADGADWSILAGNEEVLQAGMVFHSVASMRNFGRVAVGLSHTILLEEGGPRVLTGHDARILPAR